MIQIPRTQDKGVQLKISKNAQPISGTGEGFDIKKLPTMLKPFEQADSSITV